MQRILSVSVLLGLALAMGWYGWEGLHGVQGHFPPKSTPWGRYLTAEAYAGAAGDNLFERLDARGAGEMFRHAIARNTVLVGAWWNLAYAEVLQGHREEAGRIASWLSRMVPNTDTWQWPQAVIAALAGDEALLAHTLSHILQRVPQRRRDALVLAYEHWGRRWEAVARHLDAQAQGVLLSELTTGALAEADELYDLWRSLREGRATGLPDELTVRVAHVLLHGGHIPAAKEVWATRTPYAGQSGVWDGGFETTRGEGRAFDWYFAPGDVTIERERSDAAFEGAYSLHLRFHGRNDAFHHVRQIIPVEPGRAYRLSFARRSRDLTTDKGVLVRVEGFRCQPFAAKSPAVTGSQPWSVDTLDFTVPEDCQAIHVVVQRPKSLLFDGKISGDYWLDDVRIEKQ